MRSERLFQLLDPEAAGTARAFRAVHHAMVAAGIGIMIANTEADWRLAWSVELDIGFWIVCAFFAAEYVLRLVAASRAPGAELRGEWPSRLEVHAPGQLSACIRHTELTPARFEAAS